MIAGLIVDLIAVPAAPGRECGRRRLLRRNSPGTAAATTAIADAFRYPPGYGYRRWGIGAVLPGLFFSPAYFWDDWRLLGVPQPRPGRRWVRYGPDLLLVNVRTRRVEDVIYGAFF